MIAHNLSYNSQKNDLIIPEYGRHVQSLIEHINTIEDEKERQLFAERIVYLMYQMNPHSKRSMDLDEKLWKHLFMIGNYDLNVSAPDGIDVQPHMAKHKPARIDYPQKNLRYRHYGYFVEKLVEKAINTEDKQKQLNFLSLIGSYLKLAYKTWSKDQFVSDESIYRDLKAMVKDKIEVPNNLVFDYFNNQIRKQQQQNQQRKRSSSSNSGQRRSYKRRKR